MPEWLIWMLVVWFVFGFMGRRRGWSCGSGRPRLRTAPHDGNVRLGSGAISGAPRMRAARRESPEERLQRQFVEGRLTMEEYETELAKVIRPGR